MVPSVASASTTWSRSEPAARSKTTSSRWPSRWRTSQLDNPSAKRRAAASDSPSVDVRLTASSVGDSQSPGARTGSTIEP